MADGELCKNCGYQETEHELGKAFLPNGEECFDFESSGKEILTLDSELAKEIRMYEKMSPLPPPIEGGDND